MTVRFAFIPVCIPVMLSMIKAILPNTRLDSFLLRPITLTTLSVYKCVTKGILEINYKQNVQQFQSFNLHEVYLSSLQCNYIVWLIQLVGQQSLYIQCGPDFHSYAPKILKLYCRLHILISRYSKRVVTYNYSNRTIRG